MATSIGPKIGIDGEAEYRKAMNNIIQQAKTLDSEMKAVSSSWDKNTTAQQKNADKAKVLAKEIENQKQKVEMLSDMLQKSADKYGENDSRTLKWKEALNNATAELNNMEKELDDTTENVDDLSAEQKKAEKQHEAYAKAMSTIKTVAEGVGIALVAMATAVVSAGKALVNGVSEVAQYGDNIDKMSQKMNMSAEAYQEWDFVAQHCGTSVDSLKTSMKTLATQAQTNTEYFDKLGIAGAESMPEEELFNAVITGLQGVESDTERTYIASKLLGKGATELGALMNMTADDVEAMKQQAHDLGIIMSDETVKASATFQDSLQNLKQTIKGLKNNLLGQFLPAFTQVMDGLTAIFTGDDGGIAMIGQGIQDFITQLTTMMPQILELGASIVMNLATAIIENLPALISAGAETILMIVNALIENLPQIIEAGMEIILQLAEALADNLDTLLPAVVECIMAIVEGLINNIDKIIEVAGKLLVGIITGLAEALPKLISYLPKIIETIINKFKNTDWASIGKNIINGIKEGIKKFVTGLYDTVKEICSNLVDKCKSALGIASPSKVFAKEIGKFIPEGISVGIDKNVPAMLKDAQAQFSRLETTLPTGNAYNYGGFNIVVNATEGQSAKDIANDVMNAIQFKVKRKEAVFG